jgi:hypothetical protein
LDIALQSHSGPYLLGEHVTLARALEIMRNCLIANLVTDVARYCAQAHKSLLCVMPCICQCCFFQTEKSHLLCQIDLQADIVLYPFMERFAFAMPEFAGYDVMRAFDGTIGRWLSAVSNRRSSMLASADANLFRAAIRWHKITIVPLMN